MEPMVAFFGDGVPVSVDIPLTMLEETWRRPTKFARKALMFPSFSTTEVFDSYWRFAAERLAMYYRRLGDPVGPWTDDLILREYRFTNTFRAADRVSQYPYSRGTISRRSFTGTG